MLSRLPIFIVTVKSLIVMFFRSDPTTQPLRLEKIAMKAVVSHGCWETDNIPNTILPEPLTMEENYRDR